MTLVVAFIDACPLITVWAAALIVLELFIEAVADLVASAFAEI